MANKIKPKRYWKDLKITLQEARKVKKKYRLKALPCTERLNEMGYGGLGASIEKYHGGMRAFRELLGEEQRKLENGMWDDEEFIIDYARQLIKENELQRLPTYGELNKMGETSFTAVISKYHGGMASFRIKLEEAPIRKRGMWNNKYIEQEAKRFMGENNLSNLPGAKRLRELGCGDLASAIDVSGGFKRFRDKMNLKRPIREKGELRDRKYVVSEVKRIMQENGLDKMPNQKKLFNLGESSIAHAISRFHGGFYKFRKSLGEEPLYMPSGTWQDRSFALNESRKVIRENNLKTLPCAATLRKLGYGTLSSVIDKYHGGYRNFRNLLGEGQKKIEGGKLSDFNFVFGKIKGIMQENNLNHTPSAYWLQKNGYSSIAAAVCKHHGGFRKFRAIKGEKQLKREEGAWKNLDYTIEQAHLFLQQHPELKSLPSHGNLILYPGGGNLSKVIVRYHGGLVVFRKILEERLGISSENKSELEGLVIKYMEEEDEQ